MVRRRNTTRTGQRFSDATVQAVWQKGRAVLGYDSRRYRKDACNTWMDRLEYGNAAAEHGWEIDHIRPVAKSGDDELSNLQPLQWANNRHKGDAWPHWTCAA
jgi:hypothetical protein